MKRSKLKRVAGLYGRPSRNFAWKQMVKAGAALAGLYGIAGVIAATLAYNVKEALETGKIAVGKQGVYSYALADAPDAFYTYLTLFSLGVIAIVLAAVALPILLYSTRDKGELGRRLERQFEIDNSVRRPL